MWFLSLEAGLEIRARLDKHRRMPLIKLNRINKGGEIVVGSEHIVYIEVESKATTIHMTDGLLFSVEERMDAILEKLESLEASRIRNGMQQVSSPAKEG